MNPGWHGVCDDVNNYDQFSWFSLSGYPHLKEAYWFGEGVLPELQRRGRWRHPAVTALENRPSAPYSG